MRGNRQSQHANLKLIEILINLHIANFFAWNSVLSSLSRESRGYLFAKFGNQSAVLKDDGDRRGGTVEFFANILRHISSLLVVSASILVFLDQENRPAAAYISRDISREPEKTRSGQLAVYLCVK